MNVNKKLDSFSRKVMDEATGKNLRLMEELDTELQERLAQIKSQTAQKAEGELREAARKAAADRTQYSAETSLEARKTLLARRNAMMDELFDGVRRRLEVFTQSGEYLDYLIRKIERLPGGDNKVWLGTEDAARARTVAEATGMEVEVSREEFIGGFIAVKGRRIIDRSFRSRLEREREEFNWQPIKR